MRPISSVLFVCLTACACSSTPPANAARDVNFLCTNGETISISYVSANGTATLTRHGAQITLQEQLSASGFVYSNGPNTIRGKGDNLTVEIGRMVPIQCRVK